MARSSGDEEDALASLARKEERAELGVEATSTRLNRTQHEEDDLENQNSMGPQRSNTTSAPIWSSGQMSLPQEILFVATVCLTQFCNRESPDNQLQPPWTPSYQPSAPLEEWLVPCGLL